MGFSSNVIVEDVERVLQKLLPRVLTAAQSPES
jgi:hypothetical protein